MSEKLTNYNFSFHFSGSQTGFPRNKPTVQNVRPVRNPSGGNYASPTYTNGNGRYEDLDGNGFIGFNDVVSLYQMVE